MMKAGFGKASAWVGAITGVFGLLSLTGFYQLVIANALGATLWFFLVGARLLPGWQSFCREIRTSRRWPVNP